MLESAVVKLVYKYSCDISEDKACVLLHMIQWCDYFFSFPPFIHFIFKQSYNKIDLFLVYSSISFNTGIDL